MLPLVLQFAALFVVGALLGSLVNWATYSLAWNPRPISPWMPPPPDAGPRGWLDRVPVLGWFKLNREAAVFGPQFWWRPLLIELASGAAVAALYWWEVVELGLVRDQLPWPLVVPRLPIYFQFVSHVLLLCLMLAASLIDIDEKIIPDEITVPGTVIGLLLATLVPMSLLPNVTERARPSVIGDEIRTAAGDHALGAFGAPLWLEPVTAVAPRAWPPHWAELRCWPMLLVALVCYLAWCFALAPRIWRGRRGWRQGLRLIVARVWREYRRPPLSRLVNFGVLTICLLWLFVGPAGRVGLLTALIGLVASGAIVWAVRLSGGWALRREAMGFGDVTLMMMIGTFLGWQACLILFFIAPFAGLAIGLLQFALRRDDEIPYGPFLCLAAAVVVVCWADVWKWAAPLFGLGWLVPAVMIVCVVLLGIVLAIWQLIKAALFRSH